MGHRWACAKERCSIVKIVYSPECLKYSQPLRGESPERVEKAAEFLEKHYVFLEPKPASDEDLLQVHTEDLVNKVKTRTFTDLDCPKYERIYEYAKLAAGGAILAAEENAFSLMRPPGHHAGRNSLGGFCYFNNIAVAVRRLRKRTLIVDIDGHHGNGTEDIFFGDSKVAYISLHRHPLYPGTGGKSRENCLNIPLPESVGDEAYIRILEKVLGVVGPADFEIVGVSAGFDAYEKDPYASLGLSTDCYRRIGKVIGSLGLPVFAVLEGGYVAEDLGLNINKFLQGLIDRE